MSIYDAILEDKRGYVSRLPENKKAIMTISGGLDSIITCARLIVDYGLEIFPLYIKRGQNNAMGEEASVEFFTRWFQTNLTKKLFHNPWKITALNPPLEIKQDLESYMKQKGYPVRDTIIQLIAVQYAVSLTSKNQTIKTIFCAIGPEDPFPHTSLVSMRANTVNTCENLGDWNWLITSPNVDPYIFDKPFGKVEEILWADKNNIPTQHTFSCYRPVKINFELIHCGKCLACQRRKKAFKIAKIRDLTKYLQ